VWLGLALGLPLSALFMWLAVRNANLGDVRDVLADARPLLVLCAVVVMGGVYVLQGTRWRVIAGAPGLPRRRFVEMVVAGVACNNVLPARLGDLFRARWLGRDAAIPGGRALGTVIVDRGFDLATLVAMLLASAWFVGDAGWLRSIAVGGVVVIVVLAGALLFARLYTRAHPRRRRMQRSRPRRIVRDLLEGLSALPSGRRLVDASVLSLAAWGTWALAAWLVGRSLGVDLSPADVAFTCAVMNLGVAIPSSPGFVGTYQWLGVSALGLIGIGTDSALAFSVLLHAIWYVPTTLGGGVILAGRALRAGRDGRKAERRGPAGISRGGHAP
jgi:uncharacterized protein (TIRG00374 family)